MTLGSYSSPSPPPPPPLPPPPQPPSSPLPDEYAPTENYQLEEDTDNPVEQITQRVQQESERPKEPEGTTEILERPNERTNNELTERAEQPQERPEEHTGILEEIEKPTERPDEFTEKPDEPLETTDNPQERPDDPQERPDDPQERPDDPQVISEEHTQILKKTTNRPNEPQVTPAQPVDTLKEPSENPIERTEVPEESQRIDKTDRLYVSITPGYTVGSKESNNLFDEVSSKRSKTIVLPRPVEEFTTESLYFTTIPPIHSRSRYRPLPNRTLENKRQEVTKEPDVYINNHFQDLSSKCIVNLFSV